MVLISQYKFFTCCFFDLLICSYPQVSACHILVLFTEIYVQFTILCKNFYVLETVSYMISVI